MQGFDESFEDDQELDFLRIQAWCVGRSAMQGIGRHLVVDADVEVASGVVTLNRADTEIGTGFRWRPFARLTRRVDGCWSVCWFDGDGRVFRPYYLGMLRADLHDVLTELDRDPRGVFWRDAPR